MARSKEPSTDKNDPLKTIIGRRRFNRQIPIEEVEEAAESPANIHSATVKVSSDYRVTIPREIRSSLKLKPGQRIEIVPKDGTALLIPIRHTQKPAGSLNEIKEQIKSLEGILSKFTTEAVVKSIREDRER